MRSRPMWSRPIATMKSWRQTGMNALRDVMGRGSIGVFEAMSIMNTAPISLLAELPRMVSVRLSELSFQEFWNCARAGAPHSWRRWMLWNCLDR